MTKNLISRLTGKTATYNTTGLVYRKYLGEYCDRHERIELLTTQGNVVSCVVPDGRDGFMAIGGSNLI